NLLDNAIKYTKKGEINVSISPTPKNAQIKIQDTGQGLNEKEMNGLFKRYHRGIKEGIKGMGIGLYIAKKVIDDHKGKIWAESEGEGKGSAFFIELPAS
ncbi:MAG: two-component sensor histidine kinase, partial [Candidatus Tagabacteria bacterium CG09_land_8_20_14_0_10_41_14]